MKKLRIVAIATLAVGAPALAYADTAREVLEAVTKCAGRVEEGVRLQCYDAAAARAKSLLAAPPATADTATGRSDLEGFGLPRPPQAATKVDEFGRPPPAAAVAEITSLSAMAIEFARNARGKSLFVLDNGQVWRQIDSDSSQVLDPAAKTFKVTIERGVLGSYNLTMEGRNGLVKVMRLR